MKPSAKKSRRKQGRKQNVAGARESALSVLEAVLVKGRSLSAARSLIGGGLEARDRALAMELVNGVLRWRFRLEALLARLLRKPLRKKDYDIQLLLMLALYELEELRTPDYAVVNEAVALSRRLGKKWAASMVNAVLRGFIRDRQALATSVDQDRAARRSHPGWLIELLAHDWPEQVDGILDANNQRPPMWLRVNQARIAVDDYVRELELQHIKVQRHPVEPGALMLDAPVEVDDLPGFNRGLVSVQDASAQLAAGLLQLEGGARVLDMCAAPGGKTCHILESAAGLEMTAVELEPLRMQKVKQNLDRLGFQAQLIIGDATSASSWWDGNTFDRILVDAPCSATGVIRRHPDIKSLRQQSDLQALTETQRQILDQSWRMLKPGGLLLYVTCSVLKRENEQQIAQLLSAHADAAEVVIDAAWGIACEYGRQLLPGENNGDGFYFAKLQKQGVGVEDTAIA